MDAGDPVAAEQALQNYDGPRHSAYQLRAGLLAVMARRLPPGAGGAGGGQVRRADGDGSRLVVFSPSRRGGPRGSGHPGQLALRPGGACGRVGAPAVAFCARSAAGALADRQLNETQLNSLRNNLERFQGTRNGYDFARSYATALAALGRSLEAQTVLDRQLVIIPPTERNVVDQFRLMLGLIAGERSQTGRQAFRQLLRGALLPDTQRIALQLLVRGAGTPAERDQLRRDLTDLIAAPAQHPIIEDLLLTRAQLELTDKTLRGRGGGRAGIARALSRFEPESLGARRAPRRGVDLKRYRAAADVIAQLRSVIGPAASPTEAQKRAQLGVLLAEAWFRAGADAEEHGADGKSEFRNAADAYEAALHEAPLAAPAGGPDFPAGAGRDSRGPPRGGGQATGRGRHRRRVRRREPLAGGMEPDQGNAGARQTADASARVEKLLAGGTAGVPPELRIRLMWLRAKLSFDNGRPEAALQQADELLALLPQTPQLDEALRTNVTSTTQLLKAQSPPRARARRGRCRAPGQ
ncbi:MAG: hypothetical protein WDM96_02630, partial [Lacunisphaera sp.]